MSEEDIAIETLFFLAGLRERRPFSRGFVGHMLADG